jgi:SagB-type dehydrogenase family enzyme
VVPSGGGRHPTDAFVVIKNLTGFGGGLLHFDTSELQLRYISEGIEIVDSLSIIEEEVIVILCPEYLRAMWRYRDPRSFRAVPVDVGHVVGAIEIMSSFLGINAVQTFCFNSQTLKDQIGVLGESQVPMVVMRLSGSGDV